MNSRVYGVLISFLFRLIFYWASGTTEERHPVSNGFLGYRTTLTFQKYCVCKISYSCSCCQSVVILYNKAEKNLCVNFTYQRNGLNIDVMLNFDTLRASTITDYKPLKFCTNIPRCYFSYACINVLELNKFPRSITACLRLDILSKKRLWQLNYDCVSISTELPTVPGNGTTAMNGTTGMGGMSTTMKTGMTSTMASSQTTKATTKMTTVVETEETTTPNDVEVITVPGTKTTIVDID
ncbi:PREDICTED: uncharacterized protein LOC108554805 [Eufriesea mexicana]|uniref:uncharacterized protein LOC108554805 n=1 Tax=Eufriesea mexicana TaxID=516756 RepID=UPI00083C3DF4|nr:PREDICTED: uncharacterized protein LOC108554805 [Eufriesea mexicana]